MNARRALRLLAALALVAALATPLVEAGSGNSQAHVKRRPPQAQAPDGSGSDDEPGSPGVQVHPSAGNQKSVQIRVRADDDNGHNDITRVAVTVYQPDNATVHRAEGTAGKETGNGRRGTYVYTFQMDHYDPAGTYHVKAVVTDRDGDSSTAWSNFTYGSLSALSLSTSTVSLNPGGNASGGSGVSPGASTHPDPSEVTITNAGNVAVDLQYSGTALTNATTGDSIAVGNVHMSYHGNMTEEFSLTEAATTDAAFNLAPGETSSKSVHFAVHVPEGVRPGQYAGTITLRAVSNA